MSLSNKSFFEAFKAWIRSSIVPRRDHAVDEHGVGLPNAMHAVHGLRLDRGIHHGSSRKT